MGQVCPRCGKERMHRSHVSRGLRPFTTMLRLHRYRCHECNEVRWQRHSGRSVFDSNPKRRRRALILAGVVVAVGAITGLSVIYLTQSP